MKHEHVNVCEDGSVLLPVRLQNLRDTKASEASSMAASGFHHMFSVLVFRADQLAQCGPALQAALRHHKVI